ncbi:RabGAP/TBC [Glonium stellatum]|uniref:RabGAP/TBC n=1 Tax=Glonium stellatum TaxID=574774 RepID=A0A8E2JNT5_9PEZI|nr:RabGAP/TBC [Glonium stellatum]
MVSEEPRRRRTIRRTGSNARSSRSANPSGTPRRRRSQRSLRPPGSVYSYQSTSSHSITQNPFRYAANRLPHNKDRRWMDEASDMLTLPPGLADIAEQEDGGRAAMAMKRKEWEREEKWRKMAKIVTRGANTGGMIFEFDTKDSKLISRTWKGIPDRWRATAWYAFLSASAKVTKNSPTDEELIESFYELQEESSADDVQIDVDVPRTINSHIMFRRRYRGGQRLLFRVLHAMSLYLPDTGYVQGMAALTATLLCYYDEEKAFVMLVRLWQLRGLERLYESGFEGLMEALKDFEENWLAGGDVAKKLEELNITSTAYGTRWYLTLFNYSIPFPAQLRVWDVFMLLGDASNLNSPTSSFSGDLDVLHATSAALIDATREILLDSDFENAMKVLTSWVPIKDEDLLMRVAKAEWKMRKKRANAA